VQRDLRAATVVVCADAFDTLIDPARCRAARDDETLAEMAPAEPGAWVCMVDDRCIPRALWHHMPPPGSVVRWRRLPQGGGRDGGGSLRAVLQIAALIAINSLTGGLGGGLGASLFRAGLALGANALIANLVPIQTPDAGRQTYTAQAANNQARLGQPIPDIFGYDDSFPDLAAQPYSFHGTATQTEPTVITARGVDQWLHLLLSVGAGQHHICRVSIGDTDIMSFDDVEIVRIGPGQSALDGPGAGVENVTDQTLVDPRWITHQDAVMVEMRPGNFTGPWVLCPRGRTLDAIGIDLIQPQGMTREVRMRWRHEAQLIDDDDRPVGAWFELGSHTTTRETSVPLRYPHDYVVPAGRYQVRTIRTDETDEDNLQSIDVLSLLAIRARLVGVQVNVPDLTMVAVRLRATGQINGSLRFRVRCYRMLPKWSGSAWSAPEITRSPAWAIAQVLRSRGTADENIDLASLLALAAVWEARYDSFDYKFAQQISTWDAITTIARVGRAAPLMRGSRYTVVRDSLQTMPVAAYGMRNIVRGSVRIKPTLPSSESVSTLDVEYWDPQRQLYDVVTAQIVDGVIQVYRTDIERAAAGYPPPDINRRGRLRFDGVIGFNHACRMAAYTLADRYFRNVDVELDAELDGQLPAPYNLVVFQHDVGNFGETGDVVTWSAGALTLTTTEPLTWSDGSHALRLVKPTGGLTQAIAATRGADDYTVVLGSDPGFTPITSAADRERTRFVFGQVSAVGALAKVRAISPSAERRIGLRLVLEDDRVHTADARWIAQDTLPDCAVSVASQVLLFDDFNGSGLLQFHTPDIAPAGFTWGIGTMAVTGGSAQGQEVFAYGTGFSVAPRLPFYIEMIATRPALNLPEGEFFRVYGNDGGQFVQLRLETSRSNSSEVNAVFTDTSGSEVVVADIAAGVSHTLRLRFNADGVTAVALLNGEQVGVLNAFPPTNPITQVSIYVSAEFTGGVLYQGSIQSIRIAQGDA
jgi:hypothetical protein